MTNGPLLMRDGHQGYPAPESLTHRMSNPLLYAVCGLVVGALVGLTGVGGGSLMTPILMLIFGQPPAMAVGTDLMFSASTKLVATASLASAVESIGASWVGWPWAVFQPPVRSLCGLA